MKPPAVRAFVNSHLRSAAIVNFNGSYGGFGSAVECAFSTAHFELREELLYVVHRSLTSLPAAKATAGAIAAGGVILRTVPHLHTLNS